MVNTSILFKVDSFKFFVYQPWCLLVYLHSDMPEAPPCDRSCSHQPHLGRGKGGADRGVVLSGNLFIHSQWVV